MVVGKNNSQNLARAVSSPKLPPLPKLRVRRPNTTDANPCCWASQGYSAQGCAMLEQSLRACMDARKPTEAKKSNINYHLSRFYPQIIGPHKRK
ncbi:40S ribosomal protein mrp10 [Friedmanniomyces endolithicus]|nr:40S ribosomal protein mrp10 [Friedmanniomyces endolithicus]